MRDAQTALMELGFAPGPVDNSCGPRTAAAMGNFIATYLDGEPFDDQHYSELLATAERWAERSTEFEAPVWNWPDHFERGVRVTFPAQYVFTDGEAQPSAFDEIIDPWPFAADFNHDGCDDVMVDFFDSYGAVQFILGDPEGALQIVELIPDANITRSIRNIAQADLDGDGLLDLVGFTAPHGFYRNQLGPRWDWDEPDLIALWDTDTQRYRTLGNTYSTYSHGGVVVRSEGELPRVLQINEKTSTPSRILSIAPSGDRVSVGSAQQLSGGRLAIYDADSADLDGDGDFEYVLQLGPIMLVFAACRRNRPAI